MTKAVACILVPSEKISNFSPLVAAAFTLIKSLLVPFAICVPPASPAPVTLPKHRSRRRSKVTASGRGSACRNVQHACTYQHEEKRATLSPEQHATGGCARQLGCKGGRVVLEGHASFALDGDELPAAQFATASAPGPFRALVAKDLCFVVAKQVPKGEHTLTITPTAPPANSIIVSHLIYF